jgi:hypothetical protein
MSRFVSKVYISKVLSLFGGLFGGEGLIVADPSYDYSAELHLAAASRPPLSGEPAAAREDP